MNPKKKRTAESKEKQQDTNAQPVALKLKKADLVDRLYDKGFSHYTLPSVARPITKNSHSKPVTSNLYSLSNVLTKKKKQKQHSILFNVREQSYLNPQEEEMIKSKHSAFMHTTTNNFYKGAPGQTMTTMGFQNNTYRERPGNEIKEEFYDEKNKVFKISKNPAHTVYGTFGKGIKKKERLVTPMTNQGNADQTNGFSNTNVNFYSRPAFPEDVKRSVQTAGNFYPNEDTEEKNYHQIDERTFEHSQLIINKLRGKKPEVAKKTQNENEGDLELMKSQFNNKEIDSENEEADNVEPITEKQLKEVLLDEEDNVSVELDAYIKLVLKNSSSVDEFVYLTPTGSSNPYKLKLCDYQNLGARERGGDKSRKGEKMKKKKKNKNKIREPPIMEYYTISGKGLCHYKNGKPIEFISLTNWMKERETFKQIQSLKFFQKFRKWKTLKMWKNVLQTYKRSEYKKKLTEKLFVSNEHLRRTLLDHRDLCYEMSKLEFTNLKTQSEGTNEVINLSKFSDNQQNRRNDVQEEIKKRSKNCREVVKTGFKSCLDHLRESEFNKKQNDAVNRPDNKNYFKIKETAYEKLGFGNNMNYDQRSRIRHICIKFLRFSFLIDFLTLDSLSTIFMNSVKDLEEEISRLSDVEKQEILRDPEGAKNTLNKIMPMFSIDIEFVKNVPQHEEVVEKVEIKKYEMPEYHESSPNDYAHFNILGHPYLIDRKGIEEAPDPSLEIHDSELIPTVFYQHKVTNIHEIWLNLNPNMKTLSAEIDKVFTEGMNSLKSFERWSRHSDMEHYSNILEEWDDQIGDSGEGDGNTFLNPEEWVDDRFKTLCKTNIKSNLRKSFNKASKYLEEFIPYLQIYWEYKNLDFKVVLSEYLNDPRQIFKSLFMVNQYHEAHFESDIPYQADLGLLRIASNTLKNEIKPIPKTTIELLKEEYPKELKHRQEMLKIWIDKAAERLNYTDEDEVKAFVVLKDNVESIEEMYNHIKTRIKTVEEMRDIAREMAIDLGKGEYDTFKSLTENSKKLEKDLMSKTSEISDSHKSVAKMLKEERVPQLLAEVRALSDLTSNPRYLSSDSDIDVMIEELDKHWTTLLNYREQQESLNEFEDKMNLEPTSFEEVKLLESELHSKVTLWNSLRTWGAKKEESSEWKVSEIDVKSILRETEKAGVIVKACRMNIPSDNEKLKELEKLIKNYERTIRVVDSLQNKDLQDEPKEKHNKDSSIDQQKFKNEISNILDLSSDGSDSFPLNELTMGRLYEAKAAKHLPEIAKLSTQISKEKELEKLFNENVNEPWNKFRLELQKEGEASGNKEPCHLLKDTAIVSEDMDKLINTCNNIYTNRFLVTNKSKVAKQMDKLWTSMKVIDEWIKFQNQWVYLEKIFGTQEFKGGLSEAKLFESTTATYKKLSKTIYATGNIAVHFEGKKFLKKTFLPFLKNANNDLNTINKSLNEFLNSKRVTFPRLHFISNDEMVVLLAKHKEIQVVQQYVGKLFENVKSLNQKDENSIEGIAEYASINGIVSRDIEVLYFKTRSNPKCKIINIEEGIESWLKELDLCMTDTLTKLISEGYDERLDIETGDSEAKKKFYLENISQVVAVAHQILWTKFTESNIDDQALKESMDEILDNMEILTNLVSESQTEDRHQILVSVITQEVHNRDIVQQLLDEGIESSSEFLWQQQLRYDFDEQSTGATISVYQINSRMDYGYEYIGPNSRIVITPLTDRCWITITAALHLGLGAAPAGPAGTGKTESTKDLAKSMGRMCVVFNCSDQINYKMMQMLFKGVIIHGAWTCLDEFNRIDIEVLSVIAQQLLDIYLAKVGAKEAKGIAIPLDFDGPCTMKRDCGIFITMNPGYAGRSELPDNLKVLFRPVAMMIPDYAQIAEILLLSEGFKDSKRLASKTRDIYKLSSEQLSQQKHYDFGMRALKSVLVMAGKLKKKSMNEKEDIILIQAIKDANIPKFLADDLELFEALVQDLFPNVELKSPDQQVLINAIDKHLDATGYEKVNIDPFKQKVCQLYETINVRFGVVVIGEAMVGKSMAIRTLQGAMSSIRRSDQNNNAFFIVKSTFINPKSITMGELFGEENLLTKDWHDGLASHYIRQATTILDQEQMTWIVFDGPVDALWIENMNSVLDDSRLLCLANGQRIRLSERMRILFEVGDLDKASPATVSRLGVVFMSKEDIGWRPIVDKWFKDKICQWRIIPDDKGSPPVLEEEELERFREQLIEGIDEMIRYSENTNKKEPITTLTLQRVQSVCNYLELYLTGSSKFKTQDEPENKERCITNALALSLGWAFGGSHYEEQQASVSREIKEKYRVPGNSPIYDLYIDYEEQTLNSWVDLMEKPEFDREMTYYEIVVPTVDSVKTTALIKGLFDINKHVFLTGASGSGKSVIAQSIFRGKEALLRYNPVKFTFSAKTSAGQTQATILDPDTLHPESKYRRSAKAGMVNIITVDDINMPAVEEYGAQPPIELLRQLIDYGYLYELKEMSLIDILMTCLFSIASPPGGGRSELSRRFTRHLNILCYNDPNEDTLREIFKTILNHFMSDYNKVIRDTIPHVVKASIEIFQKMKTEMLPIPAKFHYTFNLRDVSKVIMGLTQSNSMKLNKDLSLAKLFIHESARVFHDRLVDNSDKKLFNEKIIEISHSCFLNLKKDDLKFEELMIHRPILFTGILSHGVENVYDEITDLDDLTKKLNDHQMTYNSDSQDTQNLNLVFFKDAIDHILRIYRVLNQERGNSMLIGIGGLGKQSLTRLATHIIGYSFQGLEVNTSLTAMIDFTNFMKKNVLEVVAGAIAGKTGKPLTLLAIDNQINNDEIFEMINSLLNTGEVPNIYQNEEKTKLIDDLMEQVTENGQNLSSEDVFRIFIERVRKNLHIVLCMSPIGEKLRVACRQFPALVDCCTIDWYENWPKEALFSVSHKLLSDSETNNAAYKSSKGPSGNINKGDLDKICKIFEEFHSNSIEVADEFFSMTKRRIYITPKTILDLVKQFKELYTSQKEVFDENVTTLKKGCIKLAETNDIVAALKEKLTEETPILEEKQKLTTVLTFLMYR